MRLYTAICEYIEARGDILQARAAHIVSTIDAPPEPEEQPQPNGNCFSDTSMSYQSDRNHELNSHDRPGHYGRSISLKWWPPNVQN